MREGYISIDYDALVAKFSSLDGGEGVLTFDELNSYIFTKDALEEMQGNYSNRAAFNPPRGVKEWICKIFFTGTGALHRGAWSWALKLAGVNPWVRVFHGLGEYAAWA